MKGAGMPLPRPEKYTPEQLAELWGCKTSVIYDYVNSGKLNMKEKITNYFGFNSATGREEFIEHGLDRFFELDEVLHFEAKHGIGQQQSNTKKRDPDNPKSRNTLLQMIAVMAIKGYKYNPDDSRSTVPATIVNSAQSMGIALDPKTVREWLQQATEYSSSEE